MQKQYVLLEYQKALSCLEVEIHSYSSLLSILSSWKAREKKGLASRHNELLLPSLLSADQTPIGFNRSRKCCLKDDTYFQFKKLIHNKNKKYRQTCTTRPMQLKKKKKSLSPEFHRNENMV